MKSNCKKNVAVIMSVYSSDNPEAFKNSVMSIINQSFSCTLYLYRDGEVPLPLQKEINEFAFHPRVKYFCSESNSGLACSLNKLIDRLVNENYDFIARMDSDDLSRVDRIAKQVSFFNRNEQVDICGTFCREFGASYALSEKVLPVTHDELVNFSITRCPFIHPTVMFRSKIFKNGIRYPTNTDLTEDMALWFELLSKGYVFGNIDEILLDYRLNENTINRRKGIGKAISEVRIRTSYMFSLNKVSLKNILLIYSRIVFHLMPSSLIKLAYMKR